MFLYDKRERERDKSSINCWKENKILALPKRFDELLANCLDGVGSEEKLALLLLSSLSSKSDAKSCDLFRLDVSPFELTVFCGLGRSPLSLFVVLAALTNCGKRRSRSDLFASLLFRPPSDVTDVFAELFNSSASISSSVFTFGSFFVNVDVLTSGVFSLFCF